MSSLVLELVLGALAVLGVAFGLRCYLELRRWARYVNRGKVLIGWKQRAVFQATVRELVEWTMALREDERARGRMLWRSGHASFSILEPAPPPVEISSPGILRRAIARARGARSRSSSSETAAA